MTGPLALSITFSGSIRGVACTTAPVLSIPAWFTARCVARHSSTYGSRAPGRFHTLPTATLRAACGCVSELLRGMHLAVGLLGGPVIRMKPPDRFRKQRRHVHSHHSAPVFQFVHVLACYFLGGFLNILFLNIDSSHSVGTKWRSRPLSLKYIF